MDFHELNEKELFGHITTTPFPAEAEFMNTVLREAWRCTPVIRHSGEGGRRAESDNLAQEV